eukprot:CAMPEP_0169466712 /NCGR_PEP_ID=MMETSP1042-20121227/21925_1 /TAXON_ID=464988 /ORGANISM="Hemiselmis andersenii, Strain CCMP1180" /LENGTH=55 /DNA_ID=CAMNT_0009579805 /DNA_START=45 /DNA_END=209 /DNA_ORIENTATION=-
MWMSFYSIGGLGLLSNSTLLSATALKMVCVEVAPCAWISVTIFLDSSTAEKTPEE